MKKSAPCGHCYPASHNHFDSLTMGNSLTNSVFSRVEDATTEDGVGAPEIGEAGPEVPAEAPVDMVEPHEPLEEPSEAIAGDTVEHEGPSEAIAGDTVQASSIEAEAIDFPQRHLLLNPYKAPWPSEAAKSLSMKTYNDFSEYAEDLFRIYPIFDNNDKQAVRTDVLKSYLQDFGLEGVMVHYKSIFRRITVEEAAMNHHCVALFSRKSKHLRDQEEKPFSYQPFKFPHKDLDEVESGFVTFRKHNLMVACLEKFGKKFLSYPVGSPNGFPIIAEMPLGCPPMISFFRPAASRIFCGKRRREGTIRGNNNKRTKFVGRDTPYGGMGLGETTTVGQDPRNTQCRPIPRDLEQVIEMMVPELEAYLKEIGGAPFRVETPTTVEIKIYTHKSFKTRANPGRRYHRGALRSDGTQDHEDRRRDRRRYAARRAREAEELAQERAAAEQRRQQQAHARAQRRAAKYVVSNESKYHGESR